MKNNQKGFAVIEIALLGVIVLVIGASGFYVWQSKKEANNSFNTASNQKYSSQPLDKKEADKQEIAPAKPEPAPTTTTTKTTTTTTKPKSTSPTYAYGMSISEDGCTVTASGPPGHKVLVKAYNQTTSGETSAVIPASGTVTVSSGGTQGMTVEASLIDEYGKTIKTRTGTVKPTNC